MPQPVQIDEYSMKNKGYIFAALSAISYGTNPIFAFPLYAEGMNVGSVLLMRYAIAVLMLLSIIIFKHPKSLKINAKDAGALGIMGVLMVGSSITLFESYKFLSAGIASTLLFFYPVMVALIMAVFYKEKLSLCKVICLAAAFLGVAVLSEDGNGNGISLAGFLLVMLSSLSYSLYLVFINRGPMKHIPASVVTFYVLVAGLAVLAPYCVAQGGLTLPQSSVGWLCTVGLGLLPTIVSLWCTSRAISMIGSTQTAIFGALEPLTAVVLGIFILGESLTLRPAFGMLLIFASVTVLVTSKPQGTRQ
jgi:Predicted permease, DMT superfamily